MITGNDLFLLMMNLSQVRSIDQIIRIYTESIAALYPGLSFEFFETGDSPENCLEVSTINHTYGCIEVVGDMAALSHVEQSLMRNSVTLLAVILENRTQELALARENIDLEESVKQSRLMIEKIAETAPVLIYVYDLIKRRNIFVNKAIGRILGYSDAEIESIGDGFIEFFIHRDDVSKVLRHHNELGKIDIDTVLEIEYRVIDKEGVTRWVLGRDTPYQKDDAGRTVSIVGCAMDITEQKSTLEGIQKSLEERDVMLKEIHHRVKNNMQIISSLMNLQLDSIVEKKDKDLFIECQNRIRAMAMVHEKVYGSDDLASIDLEKYFDTFIDDLAASLLCNGQKIEIIKKFEPVIIGIDQAIPGSLIVNELVSNAVKHAFPENRSGTVTVSCVKENTNEVRISVEDDGVGFDQSYDMSSPPSLGLQLVSSLAHQLKGELTVTGDHGTKFSVVFKPKESSATG